MAERTSWLDSIRNFDVKKTVSEWVEFWDIRKWTAYEKTRAYTTTIMCVTVFFLFADQNLLAPNLSAVADSFGFDEQEKDEKLGGYIAFGFFIVGGPAALIVGYLTDTFSRNKLFGAVVFFGEGACMGTYWVKTFEELLACRVLTGISIGGAIPIIFSMLGDLYPGEARVYMSTLVGVAFSAGVAGGQLLAGMVGPVLGWRAPFLMVAVPAMLCAALIAFTVEEPRRGDQEKAVRAVKDFQHRNSLTGTTQDCEQEQEQDNPITATVGVGRTGSDTGGVVPGSNNGKSGSGAGYIPADVRSETGSSINSGISSGGSCPEAEESTPAVSKTSRHPGGEGSAGAGAGKYAKRGIGESVHPADGVAGGGADDHATVEYSETVDWENIKILFNTPTAVLSYCQGIPGCVPWGMIYTFLNDYFSDARGLSVSQATLTLTIFGVGGLVGQFYGGSWGQRLYNQSPKLQCVLMGGSTILGILPMLYLLNTTDYNPGGFYFMALIAGLLVSITGPNVRAVLQNVCAPEVRGSAFAVFALTDDLGKGLGPFLVYMFISAFGGNRQNAYNVVVLFWLLCGALLLAMMFTYERDEANVAAQVARALEEHSHIANASAIAAAATGVSAGEGSAATQRLSSGGGGGAGGGGNGADLETGTKGIRSGGTTGTEIELSENIRAHQARVGPTGGASSREGRYSDSIDSTEDPDHSKVTLNPILE